MKNIGYLAQDISILHRQYYKDTREEFNKINLNPTAACILLAISDYENISQNQVARSLVIDKGLATREINKMEKLNYLTKTAGAGKTKVLGLTTEGKKVVETVQKIRSQWWEDRFAASGITPDSPLVSSIEAVVSTVVGPIQ
ncbi:MarR family winged helix-turn-helix transcriptional regulator [Companilactobacillus crustorum]|uniref:MarR family winged helix-turn-helix transcriptional regulator n=1 Tax=Companilactobacillus crustorum TaxID=392416 RepID=UPI0009579612|nr:MarR family transcriptional regulator [Companilactobacillus crustorum]APU72093.1 hypothetical protein BI355_1794 [Companilactobacillus crustorum]